MAAIVTLCFMRFFLGFGVGGDYPLSATLMSEFSGTKWRGGFVGAVFASALALASRSLMDSPRNSARNGHLGGWDRDADRVGRL